MICRLCKTEMVEGKAILSGNEGCRCFNYGHTIPAEEVKLSPCWKCPKCGHSETDDRYYP